MHIQFLFQGCCTRVTLIEPIRSVQLQDIMKWPDESESTKSCLQ